MATTKYQISLDIDLTGSVNYKGQASTAVIGFAPVSLGNTPRLLEIGRLVGEDIQDREIRNDGPNYGPAYVSFVDVTDPKKPFQIQSIELNDTDAYTFNYSIFAGSEWFENTIRNLLISAIKAYFGQLNATLPGILAGTPSFLSDPITSCHIPDDCMVVDGIGVDEKRTSLSWPASAFCF